MNSDNHTIEVFAIGTELILGRILDTNSQWIADRISFLGANLCRITLLPDSRDEILLALQESVSRGTDLIIATGGLGPTPDDVTIDALAELVGAATVMHEETLDHYVRRRGLKSREDLTPNLLKMATVPEGCLVLQNPIGWAPLIAVRKEQAWLYALPGPPKEMEAVFSRHLIPVITAMSDKRTASVLVKVTMYESEVSPLMQEVMEAFPGTYLKAYVALRPAVDEPLPVDVIATGAGDAEAKQKLDQALAYFTTLVTGAGRKVLPGELLA